MCRNIKPLFNFDPPASDEEIKNASTQYVRKLSGFSKPSKINEEAFNEAIKKIAIDIKQLLKSLQTNSPKRNREKEALLARQRSEKRFNNN